MASARKKQDEKNLKVLRDLLTLPGNKHCFDCNQRGPTYVNMTIGSFVCTKCSGMLRGLTPPHRVKSISMASFTDDEVNYVRIRGNLLCRNTWLSLYEEDSSSMILKDDQDILDFMVDKYEKKKYFEEVGQIRKGKGALKDYNEWKNSNGSSPPSRTSPKNMGIVRPSPSNGNVNGNTPRKSAEFVADFSSADIFNATSQFDNSNNNVSNNKATTTQPSFANFDNNVIFSSPNMSSPPSNGTNGFPTGLSPPRTVPPPSEDRYAALKDLDNALKSQQQHEQQHHHQQQQQQHQQQQQQQHQQQQQAQLEWGSNGSGYTSPAQSTIYGSPGQGSMYGSPSQGNFMAAFPDHHQSVSNPFAVNGSLNGLNNASAVNGSLNNGLNGTCNPWALNGNNTVIANNFNNSTSSSTGAFSSSPNASANPFRDAFSTSKFNGMNGINGSNGFNGFQQQNMFQSSHFNKPWVNVNANPFTLGVSPGTGGGSNNPFL